MSRLARLVGVVALGLSVSAAAAHAQYTVYGIRGSGATQTLVRFNSATPGTVTVVGTTGANLTGLDFRPATGELFAFDGTQVFSLNLATGAATPVATVSGGVGAAGGFDFNPTVDRIRIVDAAGTNLRVNPTTGVAIVDGAFSFAPGDPAGSGAPTFTAVAYTNSFPGTTTTMLFGIDASRGTLVRITQPNGGSVSTVGSLGLGFTPTVAGFDVVTVGGSNLAFLTALNSATMTSTLFSVNLETGAAVAIGQIAGPGGISSIAVTPVPEPATWALMATGLAGVGAFARRRARRTAR